MMRTGLVFASLVAPAVCAAAPDADALIASLTRPASSSIAFAEVRFSSLLSEPLIVSGELGYSGPTSLDRRVAKPYRETTAIRGESVLVERDGERPRSFALKRVPELRGLMNAFSALLAGDAAALRRSFAVQVTGNEDSWTLELTPLETNARPLKNILVNGSGDEARCFSIFNSQDGASVMLLGAAADMQVAPNVTLEDLLSQCRAE